MLLIANIILCHSILLVAFLETTDHIISIIVFRIFFDILFFFLK